MDYFVIDTDWDENGNSPWDTVWSDLPDDALDCLFGSLPLAAIWKPPQVALEKRFKRPDVYGFILHFAVTREVRNLLAPIVGEEAEFLPLRVSRARSLYVLHPLWPVDLDDGADVSCNGVSGNITVVRRYSFTLDPSEFDGPRHMFRMKQAKGSAARDGGWTLNEPIVSEKVKRVCEKAGISGIVFNYACSA